MAANHYVIAAIFKIGNGNRGTGEQKNMGTEEQGNQGTKKQRNVTFCYITHLVSDFSHIFLILFRSFAIFVAQSVVKKTGNQEPMFFDI